MQAVTPHTGVWIETSHKLSESSCAEVTPHTGVWIETCVIKMLLTIVFVSL